MVGLLVGSNLAEEIQKKMVAIVVKITFAGVAARTWVRAVQTWVGRHVQVAQTEP